nr:hypothetical protein [Tanacetum cinerariifolium]
TPTPCDLLVPYGDIEETMAEALLYPRLDGMLDGIQMRPGYSKITNKLRGRIRCIVSWEAPLSLKVDEFLRGSRNSGGQKSNHVVRKLKSIWGNGNWILMLKNNSLVAVFIHLSLLAPVSVVVPMGRLSSILLL